MSDLKEELREAFSLILGEDLDGSYVSAAEVVHAFNEKYKAKHNKKSIFKLKSDELI